MPRLEISSYPDSSEARRELIDFLKGHWDAGSGSEWERRMRHWWDENPAACDVHDRGRWVHADGRLVGFGGLIPALHAWQGRKVPALYATTLCVDAAHSNAAALMFLQQREAAYNYLIAHTTPNPRVQQALIKMGARAEQRVTRHFFAAGAASWLHGRSWWPALPPEKKLTTDPGEVTAVVRSYQDPARVEKWITPDYLRWFCCSRARKHHFVGLIDGEGILSSCLLVTAGQVKGLRSWDVIDAFTTAADNSELHALMGHLVKEPGLLPDSALLVTARSFPGDTVWDRTPALLRREQQVCHFFLLPPDLRDAPKHTVMAEGDLGL
jgi:hypothetical protein